MVEYTKEFNLLVARNNLNESEEQLVQRYIDGLQPSLVDVMLPFDFFELSNAFTKALQFEKIESRRSRSS